ncbi:hypothetical protein G7046_g8260 [Stylonectria norvegica]|nr:hypothetical protein G7046_g8260 [Stylonectria norvegica]
MKAARLNQDAIVASLRGQTLRVPDLTAVLVAWPPAQSNPHYAAVAPLVDGAIDAIAATQPLVAKRKNDDITLLAALWFPQAPPQTLHVLGLFAVWLVCWDDTVDANEGDLAGDLEGAEAWRARTLAVIKSTLHLDGASDVGDVDAINAAFQAFADGYTPSSSVAQRQRLFSQLQAFIQGCAIEQKLRLEHTVPGYDSYMEFRQSTVGGGTLCSLVEHANQEELPPSIAESAEVRALRTQVCVMLSLINDLLSLKKELRTDCVINAVAALLTPEKDLADVVSELVEKLDQAMKAFDAAAVGLLERVAGEDEGVIQRYIYGCCSIVTGTLEFTLKSPRYNISKLLQKDDLWR